MDIVVNAFIIFVDLTKHPFLTISQLNHLCEDVISNQIKSINWGGGRRRGKRNKEISNQCIIGASYSLEWSIGTEIFYLVYKYF